MKDFSVNDIFASVKCEFVRRCNHSEIILTRLADDFIARYSAKPYTHPQFFKEDTALTCNQLTMYADQCVQVMKKFDFLQKGGDIVQGLISAALRLLDFFAKQLYHHLREAPPIAPTLMQDSLCPSCCRLRENERVRSLRQELRMGVVWEQERIMREAVVRRGQKYDQQQLLYESLQSLEVLNEQEIRKRLGKMEADHDKHKKQILVAVQELTRANERVSTYSRVLEKSGKEYSGKFNIKDYVFQLGRHFYHNISSLDFKIRLLKQSLSPVSQQATQTEQPVLLKNTHEHIVAEMITQTDKIKGILNQALKSLTVEQNKNLQLQQMNKFLQDKLQQGELKRQEQKIEQKVLSNQINNNLAAAQGKITILEALIRKIKSRKGKHTIVDPIQVKLQDQATSSEKLSTCRQQSKTNIHSNNSGKTQTSPLKRKQSFLINPKALLRLSQTKSNSGIKSVTQQFTQRLSVIMPNAPQVLAQICEQTRSKCAIISTVSQIYFPIPKTYSSQAVSRKVSRNYIGNYHESLHISQAPSLVDINQTQRQRVSEMESIHHRQKNRLSKIDILKPEHIRNSKHRDSICIQNQNAQQLLKKKSSDCNSNVIFQELRNTFQQKSKVPTKKMLGSLKTSIALQTFKSLNEKEGIKKHFAQKILIQKRNKHKKTRNLSQQNSCDKEDIKDFRRSIEKMEYYKQKICIGQKQKQLLLNPNDSQAKFSIKNSVYRNGDCTRVILTLEQINYSTYFYSLLAKIHLKSQSIYQNLRKFMVNLVPGLYDDDNSVKQSLNCVLLAHRKCSSGQICHHLESFLQKVRNL